MNEHQQDAEWNVAEWHGKMLVDRDGERIGKLQDVYVDVENDEPQFATVKEGFIGRHLTFVPLGGIKVGPDELQVGVTREQIKAAPKEGMAIGLAIDCGRLTHRERRVPKAQAGGDHPHRARV